MCDWWKKISSVIQETHQYGKRLGNWVFPRKLDVHNSLRMAKHEPHTQNDGASTTCFGWWSTEHSLMMTDYGALVHEDGLRSTRSWWRIMEHSLRITEHSLSITDYGALPQDDAPGSTRTDDWARSTHSDWRGSAKVSTVSERFAQNYGARFRYRLKGTQQVA